ERGFALLGALGSGRAGVIRTGGRLSIRRGRRSGSARGIALTAHGSRTRGTRRWIGLAIGGGCVTWGPAGSGRCGRVSSAEQFFASGLVLSVGGFGVKRASARLLAGAGNR